MHSPTAIVALVVLAIIVLVIYLLERNRHAVQAPQHTCCGHGGCGCYRTGVVELPSHSHAEIPDHSHPVGPHSHEEFEPRGHGHEEFADRDHHHDEQYPERGHGHPEYAYVVHGHDNMASADHGHAQYGPLAILAYARANDDYARAWAALLGPLITRVWVDPQRWFSRPWAIAGGVIAFALALVAALTWTASSVNPLPALPGVARAFDLAFTHSWWIKAGVILCLTTATAAACGIIGAGFRRVNRRR